MYLQPRLTLMPECCRHLDESGRVGSCVICVATNVWYLMFYVFPTPDIIKLPLVFVKVFVVVIFVGGGCPEARHIVDD